MPQFNPSIPYKILIVDDEPDFLEATFELISREFANSSVFTAGNGAVALEVATKRIPDLIIADWEMPQMNGLELVRQLKAQPATEDIPVIMATGIMTTVENLKTALEAGAVDYVRKPIDPIELIARIKSMLTLSKTFTKLKESNATKDRLFSIVAHDLKAPLSTLHNMIEAFDMGLLTDKEELDKTMAELSIGTRNLIGLLDNLLFWSYSQMKGDDMKLIPEPLSVSGVLEGVLELVAPSARLKNIDLSVSSADNLPAVWVDKNALTLILRNLLSNAVKFTNIGGQVSLFAEVESEDICFVVQDNGVGMSKEKMAKLFTSLAESSYGTEKEKGTGLGLVITKYFVEKSGGKIGADSIEGKGTTFWFTLPTSVRL